MKNREQSILDWSLRQMDKIAAKWDDATNTAIYFSHFDVYPEGVPIDMPTTSGIKGGELTMIKNGSKENIIEYDMYTGTVLSIHHHPDIIEEFDMHEGSMVDELTGIVYSSDSGVFRYMPGMPHQFRCLERARMTIKQIRC